MGHPAFVAGVVKTVFTGWSQFQIPWVLAARSAVSSGLELLH
jgi:hypothetical protein